MAGQPDVVKLNDEHEQKIEVWSMGGAWFWMFHNLPHDDQECNGPFKSRRIAIADANDFCAEGAAS